MTGQSHVGLIGPMIAMGFFESIPRLGKVKKRNFFASEVFCVIRIPMFTNILKILQTRG